MNRRRVIINCSLIVAIILGTIGTCAFLAWREQRVAQITPPLPEGGDWDAKTRRQWGGSCRGIDFGPFPEKRRKSFGLDGQIIRDPDTFAALWKEWRDGDVPVVDFTKYFVIVAERVSWHRTSVSLRKTGGDLQVKIGYSDDSNPGFSWRIREVDAAGITTVNGEPIAKRVITALPPDLTASSRIASSVTTQPASALISH